MSAGIVVFAFGLKGNVSNRRLQSITMDLLHADQAAPVFTQVEIEFPDEVDVSHASGSLDDPPPTLREAREAVVWARERGLTKLWVVAAKPHLPRCLRDLARATEESGVGFELLVPGVILKSQKAEWFCLGAVETRTKTKGGWLVREWLLMALPFWMYRCVAS